MLFASVIKSIFGQKDIYVISSINNKNKDNHKMIIILSSPWKNSRFNYLCYDISHKNQIYTKKHEIQNNIKTWKSGNPYFGNSAF